MTQMLRGNVTASEEWGADQGFQRGFCFKQGSQGKLEDEGTFDQRQEGEENEP